jgi:hypothetical protein
VRERRYQAVEMPELFQDNENTLARRSISSQRTEERHSTPRLSTYSPVYNRSGTRTNSQRGRTQERGRGSRGRSFYSNRQSWWHDRSANRDESLIEAQFTPEQYRRILHLLEADRKN